MKNQSLCILAIASSLAISACSDSGSSDIQALTMHSVGGALSGLDGTLVLQNNGGNDLSLNQDGSFVFTTSLADGADYAVTVLSDPSDQTCSVTNGSGKIASNDVNNVNVTCLDNPELTDLSVSAAGAKGIKLSWTTSGSANLADSYSLLVNPDGSSGFTQVSGAGSIAISETEYSLTLPVHLTDWVNAMYRLEMKDGAGQVISSREVGLTQALSAQASVYIKASNTDSNDQFGYEIALSFDGLTMAVAARNESSGSNGIDGDQADNLAANSGAVYIFTKSDDSWAQQAYLKPSNTSSEDVFGTSLAISGDGNLLVVASQKEDSASAGINGVQDDDTLDNAGAVYVFSRSGNTWSQGAYLKAHNPSEKDNFGDSIDISSDGTTIAVGAPFEDGGATEINGTDDNSKSAAGAAYIFYRASRSDSWMQQAYIKASNSEVNDYFGQKVKLSADGNALAVSADGEGSNAIGVNGDKDNNETIAGGAVYIYERTSDKWQETAYIKPNNLDERDRFGRAFDMSDDGSLLAISSQFEDSSAVGIDGDASNNDYLGSGAVFIFAKSDSGWTQKSYIKASNTDSDDLFGRRVEFSPDGRVLAVVAKGESSNAVGVGGDQTDNSTPSGAVYVFTRDGNTWVQRSYVKASTSEDDKKFRSLSLTYDGQIMAVGGYGDSSKSTGINGDQDDRTKTDSGAVYLY